MGKFISSCRLLLAAGALTCAGAAAAQATPPAQPETVAPPAATPPISPPPAQAQPAPSMMVVPPPSRPPVRAMATVAQPPEQALPPIPPPPPSALPEYPNCRDDHIPIVGRVAKANKARSCLQRLDGYERDILQVFANRMNAYRESLRTLWDQVNDGPFSLQQKTDFYARIRVEFENSAREGSYMDQFRLVRGRFVADRAYLYTEICNLVTCTGASR